MTKKPAANASAVDRIVYLESLVSNTQAIDAMVDDLRLVTSRADASLRINPEDEAILKNVEKRLKEYLIHEDPLRSFTAESLAARLSSISPPSPF